MREKPPVRPDAPGAAPRLPGAAPPPSGGEPGEGKLRLRGWLGLRDGLDAAFARILDHARRQAGAGPADPVDAVHTYRKSIRRARAVLRLGIPFLRPVDVDALDDALRAALALGSNLRDADVLMGTLTRFSEGLGDASPRGGPGGPRRRAQTGPVRPKGSAAEDDGGLTGVMASTRQVLADEISATRAALNAADALAAGAAALEPLAARFSAALPPAVRAGDLEAGVARLFRRAARALRRARKTPGDDAIHAFRKRVKELRYALELVGTGAASGGVAPARTKGADERAAADLAEDLGAITDLIVLRRFVCGARDRIGDGADRLEAALEAEIGRRFEGTARKAAALFERSPREFAGEVVHGTSRA